MLAGEMRKLTRIAAAKRTGPKIIRAFFPHTVNHVRASGRKCRSTLSALVRFVVFRFMCSQIVHAPHGVMVELPDFRRNRPLSIWRHLEIRDGFRYHHLWSASL